MTGVIKTSVVAVERVQYGWYDGEFVIAQGIAGEVVELVAIKPKEEEKDGRL